MEIQPKVERIRPDQIGNKDWEQQYTIKKIIEGQKTLKGDNTYTEFILEDVYGNQFKIWDWDIMVQTKTNLQEKMTITLKYTGTKRLLLVVK